VTTLTLQSVGVRLDRVTKRFPGGVIAVNDVSFSVPAGQLVTLLGPSGCGKTTTLRLIAGLEQANGGTLYIGERDVTNLPPHERGIGMVFQSYALFPHLSVFENIAYGLRLQKHTHAEIRESVEMVLHLMNLVGLDQRMPNQLSGGQQQRVALARALVLKPRALLLDEPLSNLDAKLRVQMRTEIRRLQRRLGITAVYVTHDQSEAMSLSDLVVVMNQGRVEQIGAPTQIYGTPASVFVADFIGRANFIETKIIAVDAERNRASVSVLGRTLNVPCSSEFRAGDEVYAVLRPEVIRLRDEEGLARGEVRQAIYLGSFVEYEIEVGSQTLVVLDYEPWASRIFSEGSQVGILFREENVHLLRSK